MSLASSYPKQLNLAAVYTVHHYCIHGGVGSLPKTMRDVTHDLPAKLYGRVRYEAEAGLF